jgi:UDP-N-acetylglucosamine 1-carboxyvinyltransferase
MTDRLRITGGVPLCGTVAVSGSKNSALPIMAASILADESVVLDSVPQLSDVATLSQVLDVLGVDVCRSDNHGLHISTVNPRPTTAPYRLVRRMRASFCVLGPLLARRGVARVALPGGCNIGHRPVDLHLRGLAALGADIRIERGYVVAKARRLRGAIVNMTGPCGPTVTGTANILCAATLARGTTIIEGAAREPEIGDLAVFLTKLGAQIEGEGTTSIVVRGVEQLGGCRHRVIPDRIEAATFLLAGAITGGQVRVERVELAHLGAVLEALTRAGAELDIERQSITIRAPRGLQGVSITAQHYPGFPTDVQPQWLALAAVSRGRSTIRDEVFPERWGHVAELVSLGARIERNGAATPLPDGQRQEEGNSSAAVTAQLSRLQAAPVTASDLRAGAALILAALAARGTTTILGLQHLRRGYDTLEEKLTALGAIVRRRQLQRTLGRVRVPKEQLPPAARRTHYEPIA